MFDADGVRAAVAAAAPEVVIHQLTSLPPRLDWGDHHMLDENNRVRTEGTRILLDAALATGARRLVAQSIAFVYAPTGDRIKEEEAPLFTDAPLGADPPPPAAAFPPPYAPEMSMQGACNAQASASSAGGRAIRAGASGFAVGLQS